MTPISPGYFVADALKTRGWSTRQAAERLEGDVRVNELILDMMCCPEVWERHEIKFDDSEAEMLAKLFGTSKEMWLTLYQMYINAKASVVGVTAGQK